MSMPTPAPLNNVRDRRAALALMTGTVATLVTMSFHPSGADTLHTASAGGQNYLVRAVHALAIGALPFMTVGMLALTLRMRHWRDLAVLAFVTYSLAIVAILIAAAMSGLVSPALAELRARTPEGEQRMVMQLFHMSGVLNQAFAKIYVVLTGLAFMGWSLAMRAEPEFPRALGVLGILVGLVGIVGVASGHLRLTVHGFGAVVVAQSVWVLWTATVMRRPTAG